MVQGYDSCESPEMKYAELYHTAMSEFTVVRGRSISTTTDYYSYLIQTSENHHHHQCLSHLSQKHKQSSSISPAITGRGNYFKLRYFKPLK